MVRTRDVTQPTLTVDLGAIQRNWRRLRAQVAPAQCAAVVKANAYGLGAESVARALHAAGCRIYFVATCDEAVRMRGFVPEDCFIVVLNGPGVGECETMRDLRLEPVLSTREHIARWTHDSPRSACAVQVNTGMNRLGLSEHELENLMRTPKSLAALRPRLLMSHLSSADDGTSPANLRELLRFRRACELAALQWPGAVRSFANSSGIFLGQAWWFDLVRPGAALYGVNPLPGGTNPMETTVVFRAPLLQVFKLREREAVGYGGDYMAPPGARLATVGVGYGDGYPRSLSARGYGVLGGFRVPVAGRVSMDLTTFDVSNVPEGVLAEASSVELYGRDADIDALAAAGGTIAYELLTRFGSRVRRNYVGGA